MTNFTHPDLFKETPPKLGHEVLKYYAFDPEYINLNNGSYGSTPKPVLDAVSKLTLQIEANPDLFHRLDFQPLLIDVRRRIAQLIGADVDEVVLVANASMGVNTVLRNFEWENGDTIVECSTTYKSVDKTIRYLGDVKPHPTVRQFDLQFPTTHKDIIANFKEFVSANPTVEGKKTVVVIDSIVSNPGVKLPWQELVKICKEAGFYSVIDAAHSIGQETDINLSEAQPDFWVSVGFQMWCIRLIRSNKLLDSRTATSGCLPNARLECFMSPNGAPFKYYLQVDENVVALDFRNWLGGEHKINEYCHDLALKGGKRLAEILGTRVMDPEGDLTLNMVNVELPFPRKVKPTGEIDSKFKEKLLRKYKMYSAHFYHNGCWWTRCSAQVWNELEDFEKLGKVWLRVCTETLEELGSKANANA
ncbi:hypothetical protein C0992_012766 [Termitomyces sp. T32_za158]|nr:hypothetical protein C0992_012766 [Termitomyces sp. T32_za158]